VARRAVHRIDYRIGPQFRQAVLRYPQLSLAASHVYSVCLFVNTRIRHWLVASSVGSRALRDYERRQVALDVDSFGSHYIRTRGSPEPAALGGQAVRSTRAGARVPGAFGQAVDALLLALLSCLKFRGHAGP